MLQAARTARPPSDAILERLSRLHPKLIDLSLGRIERLLARLGHPEEALPPVVHVAGTNGKGSVIAYLRAMLESAGNRVHVYTSPHLVRFHERIRLAGQLIDEADLAALLEECEVANGNADITYFEITTAAAMLAFARQPADVLLLEVGLGGRLDATNVVRRPALSVITPVSIDHTQFLGDTLPAIAFEKAGILKPDVTAVIAPQDPAALSVIEARAAAVGTPLAVAGRDWHFATVGPDWRFAAGDCRRILPAPILPGGHQLENAAVAVACAKHLPGFGLDQRAQMRGLRQAEWPGRLQRLNGGSLKARLPQDWELWLDGGHNASAAAALAATARSWTDRPLHLVCGMMRAKAARTFFEILAPHAATLTTVAIPGETGSLGAPEAAAAAREAGFPATPRGSLGEALSALAAAQTGSARVLICGSLYLAGQALADT